MEHYESGSENGYGMDYYGGNGMVLSTPTASARKRQMASGVRPLTIPVSPNFATSRRGKYESELISSEQMRLMQLQERQEEFKREREKAQLRKEQALYGSRLQPVRSEKPLTEPQEFAFATSRRFGPPPSYSEPETPPSHKKQKLSESHSRGVTVPEPFSFATSYRPRKMRQSTDGDSWSESGSEANSTPSRHGDSSANGSKKTSASPWIPLKEKLRRLEAATPEHWKKESKPRSPVRPLVLTRPEEPLLHTSIRSHNRPSLLSESEQSSTHGRPNTQFKAHPLNRKILESSGDLGVMRVVKRPLTQAQSPKLRVAALASRRPSAAEIKEREQRELAQKRIFKAMPVNGALPAASPARHTSTVAPRPLTVAASPQLHTKARSIMSSFAPPGATPSKQRPGASRSDAPGSSAKKRTFKARPMPDYSEMARRSNVHAQPSHTPLKLTIPEPFALATEDRSAMEEQRKMEREEKEKRELAEKRAFKARPMPNQAIPFRPHLELKITDPEPFALHSEALHERSRAEMEAKLEKERKEREAKMQFKARPLPTHQPSFNGPRIPLRPLTEISAFQLNTEGRSQMRNAFEGRKHQQEEHAKLIEERRAALEAERQKQEIKRLRSQLVHKALPVPQSLKQAPAPVRASCQPLTEPKTPNFASNRRIRPLQ